MREKRKVLIVIPTLGTGGGEKFVMDLANGLNKEKFQVKILVLYPKSGSIFDRFAEENGLIVEYLDKKLGFDWKILFKVQRVVRAFSPDVIHTNLDAIQYLSLSYRRKQCKLHTVHNMADKEASGLRCYIRQVIFHIFGVTPVAISHIVQKSITEVYHIENEKIPLVYNGIECKRYELPKIPSNKIRLITVASMHKIKNHAFLIDCFAQLCQEHADLHLTLVGDGVLRADIESQIVALNLQERITLTGNVLDVENYLADADLYVAASIYEGLPISILEAMASGLPIVSTSVGGVPDVVKHERNGLLVNLGEKDAYVAALKKLIENKELRENYARAAKETAKQYDICHMIAGYEALYSAKK